MSWWQEPLSRWATALELDYQIEPKPVASEGFTGWYQQPEGWYYQLDATKAVHFLTDVPGPTRAALGWTLEQASHLGADVSHGIHAQYEELWQIDFATLVGRLDEFTTLDVKKQFSFPGYFLLLQRRGISKTPEGTSEAHWVQVLPDVLSAIFDHGITTVLSDYQDYVLIYASELTLSGAIDDLPDIESSGCTVNNLVKLSETIASMVAEDAFCDVRIAVSQRIENIDGLYSGLVSVVLASRLRVEETSASQPMVYGDSPMLLFVKLTSAVARAGFQGMLRARSRELSNHWPEDWKTLVQAVVEANLNISEAARKLFVHRNTLLHKVDRLYQITGYDIRHTKDAMILYMAALLDA